MEKTREIQILENSPYAEAVLSEGFFKEGSWEMEISDDILYTHIHTYLNLSISVLSRLNFSPQRVSHFSYHVAPHSELKPELHRAHCL